MLDRIERVLNLKIIHCTFRELLVTQALKETQDAEEIQDRGYIVIIILIIFNPTMILYQIVNELCKNMTAGTFCQISRGF